MTIRDKASDDPLVRNYRLSIKRRIWRENNDDLVALTEKPDVQKKFLQDVYVDHETECQATLAAVSRASPVPHYDLLLKEMMKAD